MVVFFMEMRSRWYVCFEFAELTLWYVHRPLLAYISWKVSWVVGVIYCLKTRTFLLIFIDITYYVNLQGNEINFKVFD